MKKKNTAKLIGLFVLLGALILFMFFRLSQDVTREKDTGRAKTDLEKLTEYDYEQEYPKTVRDVVKLYSKYLKMVYAKDTKEEHLEALVTAMRNLYAEDFAQYTDAAAQLANIKEERAASKEDKKYIIGIVVDEASQVAYDTIDNVEYAKINLTFNMRVGTTSTRIEQTYVLTKDAEGKWKIYGWADTES